MPFDSKPTVTPYRYRIAFMHSTGLAAADWNLAWLIKSAEDLAILERQIEKSNGLKGVKVIAFSQYVS